MTQPPDLKTPAEIRQWLTETMAERGISTIEWATRAGVARSTLFRALAPDYAFVTSRRTLSKLAAALDGPPAGGSIPDLNAPIRGASVATSGPGLRASGAQDDGRRKSGSLPSSSGPGVLSLRFEVRHGAWYECAGPAFSIYYGGVVPSLQPDVRYAGACQWLELVCDDSADILIQPGALAHVVDASEIDYAPRQGDWVLVERSRAGGQLMERTIRQVDIEGQVVRLRLRSSNPKWVSAGGEPDVIVLGGDLGEAAADAPAPTDGVIAEIAGLVVGAYRAW